MVPKAADQGDAAGQRYLGVYYLSGLGAPKDYSQAGLWLRKAADQGDAKAQTLVGALYKSGKGVPKDDAQAIIWYRKAADQGELNAQQVLGWMYEYGEGVQQDYAQARMWYALAASARTDDVDDADARDRAAVYRQMLAAKMTPSQIADADRMAREWAPKTSPQSPR